MSTALKSLCPTRRARWQPLTPLQRACYRRIATAPRSASPVNKKRRQQVILELVAAQPVASQEELRQLLDDRGFAVTQSTLSRDLRELRLARIPA